MFTRNTIIATAIVALFTLFGGWIWWEAGAKKTQTKAQRQLESATSTVQTEDMLVAGGCFWCVEADLQKAPGVIEAVSGYSGGKTENPTYETYAEGGHREVVRVEYDPTEVTYEGLLYYFIKHIDPTDPNGSFVDRGEEYSPAIYYATQKQKEIAHSVLDDIANRGVFDEDLAVPIREQRRFWRAETYHQDYSQKNPVRYQIYRKYSGRDAFIKKYWGKAADTIPEETMPQAGNQEATTTNTSWRTYEQPSQTTLRKRLSALEYKVIVQDGTEPPFENAYWDNKKEGIYVDKLSGEPLFSSKNKYSSGTGWPSFTKPLVPENIVLKADYSLGVRRTEVRSKHGDAHLGHVFNDGPTTRAQAGSVTPTGLRYCLNSAALEFIPADQLAAQGYGRYTDLFE